MIRGRAWKYGDNVNTDVLFPGKYTYTAMGRDEIASHALEDLDPDFASNVGEGDVIIGGRNFGCGSSREQAATCLVYNGVGAVIACREFCADFLPQCHQQRPACHRLSGSGAVNTRA